MFTDAVTSIRAYLYERNSSPLLGSIIVSWLFWNYRMLLLVFSDLKYAEKMAEIDRFYSADFFSVTLGGFEVNFCNQLVLGIAFPLLTALFYLYLYPIPAIKVYQHSLKTQQDLRIVRQKAEDAKLLDAGEARLLWSRVNESEQQLADERERYAKRLNAQAQEIEELKQLLDARGSDDEAELTREEQEEILKEEKAKQEPTMTQGDTHKSLPDVASILKGNMSTRKLRFQAAMIHLLSAEPEPIYYASFLKDFKNQGEAKHYLDALVKSGIVNEYSGKYGLTENAKAQYYEILPDLNEDEKKIQGAMLS